MGDIMNKYGYIRVSTKEQNIERQLSALLIENIPFENIFIEKASGKDFDRKVYRNLLKVLKKDDELYIKSIDRLGRNYEEILTEYSYITKVIKSNIIILDFPLLDTRQKTNDITGIFISDLVLQILSYVSQIERENILQRQKEGINEAKKKGIKFGRPKKKIPNNFKVIKDLWLKNEISLRKGATLLNVSPSTFKKWIYEN